MTGCPIGDKRSREVILRRKGFDAINSDRPAGLQKRAGEMAVSVGVAGKVCAVSGFSFSKRYE